MVCTIIEAGTYQDKFSGSDDSSLNKGDGLTNRSMPWNKRSFQGNKGRVIWPCLFIIIRTLNICYNSVNISGPNYLWYHFCQKVKFISLDLTFYFFMKFTRYKNLRWRGKYYKSLTDITTPAKLFIGQILEITTLSVQSWRYIKSYKLPCNFLLHKLLPKLHNMKKM